MLDTLFNNYIVFLAVFSRMTGMIVFNPFLGRRNVPVIVKVGLAFITSFILLGILPDNPAISSVSMFVFMFICIKELLVGFLVGFVMQMFLSVLLLAGDYIDLQLGVGMAKIYDPQSNVSMALFGSVFNVLYTVMFFISNGHLTFIKIMFLSFDIVPLSTSLINPQCFQYVALLFANILLLSIKLALPIVAIEIITEMGLGVVMRAVPQINVFAVGLQLKLLVGLIMAALILPGFFGFFDSMTNTMFESVQGGLKLMV